MNDPRQSKPDRETKILLLMLGAALLYKVVYLVYYAQRSPFFAFPAGDSAIYLDWARAIIGGDFWGKGEPFRVFYRAPLYPYLLALSIKVFGNTPLPVYIVQILLGTFNLFLTYKLARRVFSPLAGFVALGLAALYAPLLFKETKLVSVTPVITLLLLAAWLLLRATEERPRFNWALAGLCTGAATLAWGGTILFVPLLLVFWLVQRPRPRFALPALFAAAWFVAILPATFHNAFAGNDWVLVNSNSGYTFYQGNNLAASGTIVHPPEVYEKTYDGRFPTGIADQQGFDLGYASEKLRPAQQGAQQELVRPSEASGFWLKRGFDFVIKNPAAFFRLEFSKFVLAFSNLEFASNYFLELEQTEVPVLHVAFVPFALILALGLVGMGFSWRERGRQWPLYLIIVGTFLTLIAFYVGTRYRLPLVLPLAIFAGGGAAGLLERWRAHKPALAGSVAAVVLFVLSFILFSVPLKSNHAFVTSLGYRNLGEVWHRQAGDPARAIKAYDRALAIERALPGFGANVLSVTSAAEIHRMRGDALLATGYYDAAVSDFRTALQLDPRTPEPLSGLAFTFYAAAGLPGRNSAAAGALLDSAARYAEIWERADSASARPLTLLGDVLAARGDAEGAINVYERLTLRAPRFAPPYFAIAGIALARGDTARASAAYEALMRADSTNAGAHVAAGDLYAARKDTAQALAEYNAAARLDTLALEPAVRIASVHSARGKHEQAAQVLGAFLSRADANRRWQQALLNSPAAGRYFEAHLRFALALANTGDWPGATARAAAVLKLAPGHPTASQLLESFKAQKLPDVVLWQ